MNQKPDVTAEQVLARASALSEKLGPGLHDRIAASLYSRAAEIATLGVRVTGRPRVDWDLLADRILTSRALGFPIMVLGLVVILWITISGANVPSNLLARGLFYVHDAWQAWMQSIGAPWWLTGFLVNGVYRGLAWVVSVMLPPMAIFFPIFTILEDVGYLPRVAFNLDRLFRWCGAHGKQALTMGMGFGCNAAGVISCRIIDSPRERLLAIVTNNFMLCNGRWPTIIMLATVFVAGVVPAAWASVVATAAVGGITLLGIITTFVVCRLLTRTVLRGQSSHFYLELPPYRRPAILRTLYRSLIDRTIFVLGRACAVAAPAGGLIWLLGNVDVGQSSLMATFTNWLDPLGRFIGLDGVIILAFLIALPANEIVVPTMIMAYLSAGQMLELESLEALADLLRSHGWTIWTAVGVMLFSLLHYPCATTTWTIYRETRSVKWTVWANLMPLAIAILVCGSLAQLRRVLAG